MTFRLSSNVPSVVKWREEVKATALGVQRIQSSPSIGKEPD